MIGGISGSIVVVVAHGGILAHRFDRMLARALLASAIRYMYLKRCLSSPLRPTAVRQKVRRNTPLQIRINRYHGAFGNALGHAPRCVFFVLSSHASCQHSTPISSTRAKSLTHFPTALTPTFYLFFSLANYVELGSWK